MIGGLNTFLVQAKKNTYATQQGKVQSCRSGSHDLAYRSGAFFYLDSYFGQRDFSGEEVVYYQDSPIWSMNYYGKMLRENIPEGFIETLREALQNVPEETPFRGPAAYSRGMYNYTCTSEGNVNFFTGAEKIFFEEHEVYRLYFHGGGIR